MAIKPVEILITAKDKASEVFGGLKATAIGAGIAIAGYFGIRAFSGAVQGAAELEAKLSEVRAVAGASADEMQLLRQAAEDAGASTQYTATEAADALGNLARAGLTAKESIAALPATLSLAQAGQIGLSESAEIVTRTIAGFSLAAADAGRIADVLAQGANASNTSVTGLGQALSYAAPTAVSLGLSLETTVAIIGKFADAGIDASRAGTALNAILSQFSDPASKFRKELAAAGITTNDFEAALRQLEAAGPGGQKAILAVGTEAGPALRALLNQGIDSLDQLKAKLNESSGSAAEFAAIIAGSTTGAAKGLGSAWDTVKNALATPVLPVLKDGILQLTEALRGAVTSGTVGRFGEAIAAGFQSALTWARAFLAEVDFAALGQRVASAADQVGAAFVTLETYAKNTGNAVQLVWGVMSAGANTILAVVYTVGGAFAGVASNIQSGVALILQGLSKITFGGVSASFKAAADEMRVSAEATWAASEELGKKAGQALIDVADGAQTARDGWAGLTDASAEATAQAETAAKVFDQVGTALQGVGEKADEAATKQQASAQKQQAVVQALRDEINQLKADYDAAINAGDAQGAVEALENIRKKTQELNTELKKGKPAIDELGGALKQLGITSDKELRDAAEETRLLYEQVKKAGGSTRELAEAFKRMAEDAIAANGGVATEALKSEAAMRGLEIVTDSTGKTIVRAMGEGQNATESFRNGIKNAAAEVQGLMAWLDRLEKRNAAVKSVLITDKEGFAVDADGKRITQTTDNRKSAAGKLEGMGLEEAVAKRLAALVYDERGNYIGKSSGAYRDGDSADAVLARLAKQNGAGQKIGGPDQAVELKNAVELLGAQTRDGLQKTAADFKAAYDKALGSGQLTGESLAQAFRKYAEASIAANGGAATASLRGEAGLVGLEIVTDNLGKAIIRTIAEGEEKRAAEQSKTSNATTNQTATTQPTAQVGRIVQVQINTPTGRETVNTDEVGAQALLRSLQQASLVGRG